MTMRALALPGGAGPLIILSPHFDDAVISCGGILAAAHDAGRRVIVVTVFAGKPERAALAPHLRPFAHHDLRRAEDDRALALLGAEAQRLGFVERVFRDPPLRGLGAVFRALPAEGLPGFANLVALMGTIRDLRDRHPGALMLAPLGIGNHCDHVEVFLAALSVLLADAASEAMLFYEDPYGLVPALRWRHFVTGRMGLPRLFTLRTFLAGRLLAWAQGAPALESILPMGAQAVGWHLLPVSIAGCEERKLAAVRAYASQVGAMGGAGWLRTLRRQHQLFGGAEPLWQCMPLPTILAASNSEVTHG